MPWRRSGCGVLAPEIDDRAFESGVGPGADEGVVADALREAGRRGPAGLVGGLDAESVEGLDAEDGGEREDGGHAREVGSCRADRRCGRGRGLIRIGRERLAGLGAGARRPQRR